MIRLKEFEPLPDLQIVSKILSGETALYEIIIRRYNPYLFKIGRSYGFNQPDTEDLMQDTFINAYLNLEKFKNRSSLKTWLVKIMLNQCYHKKNKLSFKNEFPSDQVEKINGTPVFSVEPPATSKMLMNNELKNILEKAILKIPENYRMVFTLRELNGMNIKETSEALKISESNVKIRLKRAKGMLQEQIKKMYSPEEIFEFNLIYCNRIVENVLNHLTKHNSKKQKQGILQFFDLPKFLKMNFTAARWKNNFRRKS